MADNDAQRNAIMYAIGAFRIRFAHRADVYVSGELLIYHEEGNPRASVAPDTFVVFGADTAGKLAGRLAAVDEPERLAVVGEWIIDCAAGEEFLARLEGMA